MANSLGVSVTADVTDLQVKMAIAKAETSGLTSEMNKLAKQSAAGLIDPAGQARLQQVAGDLIKARAEAASLSSEFKEMTGATQGVGNVLGELREKMDAAFEFTGAAAAVEVIHLVGEEIQQVGEKATQIQTTAEILGVTTDQLQAMQAASKEAGTSIEVFSRSGERLNTLLFDARNNSGAAIEKLRDLGVTTAQIASPTFQINDLLGVLRERLIDSATHQQTMNELVKEFGPRAALAAAAIEKYDGSTKSVAETMARLNGLSTEQIANAHEMGVQWDEGVTKIENWGAKSILWLRDVGEWMERNLRGAHQMADAVGASLADKGLPAKQVGIIDRGAAQVDAQVQTDLMREIERQELDNIRAGVAAFKEGTDAKLAQLKIYATAAQQYYGTDTVDAVVKANQEIIAQQRAVNESDERAFQQQMQRVQHLQTARLAAITKQIDANTQWLTEEARTEEELYGGWATTYAEINNRHTQMLKEQAAETARHAKQEVKDWQGVVTEIESAEGSMVSNILTKRKSLTQDLLQLGRDLVTKEIENDVRAMTTRLLLQRQGDVSEKAMEQGGFLYHMLVQHQKTAATVSSETAQTSATIAGQATRLSAQASAAATSKAVSADVGKKTVMQDAAKAFSGTYASVAQIPYVGWILAPIAASAAFAGVAAYEGLASLDTGTNYVPQDMVAQIHEGEQIVPKQYNPAANPAMAAAGGGYSEEHNYNGDMHVSALDAPSLKRLLSRPGGRESVVSSAMRSYRRGAR